MCRLKRQKECILNEVKRQRTWEKWSKIRDIKEFRRQLGDTEVNKKVIFSNNPAITEHFFRKNYNYFGNLGDTFVVS